MTTPKFFIPVILLLFTLSCGSAPQEKGSWNDSKIEFSRGSCYGMCPAYSVTVFGNGKVLYNGYSHTKQGTDSSKISLASVDYLFSTLINNGFLQLQKEYINSSIPDLPSVTVTLIHKGSTKSVLHTAGMSTAPRWLSDFDYQIDSIVNVEQWTSQK
jgi:hypothetical protein